jgi:hypothetical protein
MHGLELEIFRIFQKYIHLPNVEIEFRFGWINPQGEFSSDINEYFYGQLREHLFKKPEIWTSITQSDYVTLHKNRLRSTYDHDICTVSVFKEFIEKVDYKLVGTPFDVRISVMKEIPTSNIVHKNDKDIVSRKILRSSCAYKMWSYDISEILSSQTNHSDIESFTSYGFEIELILDKVPPYTNLSYLTNSIFMKICDIAYQPSQEIFHLKDTRLVSRRSNHESNHYAQQVPQCQHHLLQRSKEQGGR